MFTVQSRTRRRLTSILPLRPMTQNLWESLRERLSPQFSLPELSPTLSILRNWNTIILFKKFIYDNRTHLLRIHITDLMNYLKSIEKMNKESPTIKISLSLISESGVQWSIYYNNLQ